MKETVADALTRVLVAGATLSGELDEVYGRFGITAGGFDVLRALRDDPEGRPRGAIAERLIARAPDVTRLIDRLERQGLVRRVAARSDRRLSVARITSKGADLLGRIEPALEELRGRLAPRLSAAEWKELARLCERLGGSRDRSSAGGHG
jgi:DNA-binding MarR family transcriptional regulator